MAERTGAGSAAHPPWHPRRWPLRWRLTAVLGGLTFLILVGFTVVVGRLASNRLHGDFDNELMSSARSIAAQVPAVRAGLIHYRLPPAMTAAPPAQACVVFGNGSPVGPDQGRCFGPARLGLTNQGDSEMAT